MANIIVLPEFGLVADPFIGIITSQGESLSPVLEKVTVLEATADDLVNMLAPVLEKVTVLEATADDLVNMLAGEGNMLASFPNREKGLAIGGSITSFWYGLAVGLFIAGIIAFQLIKVS